MIVRILMRRDITLNWEQVNPILGDGELGIERKTDGKIQIKFGDGATAWKSLKYFTGDLSSVYDKTTLDQILAELKNDTNNTINGAIAAEVINRDAAIATEVQIREEQDTILNNRINGIDFQEKTTLQMSNGILTGGAIAGTFGDALSIDTIPTENSTNLITSDAVYRSILAPSLATQPHKWIIGTEIDFNDGTFGYRATGTISGGSSEILTKLFTADYNNYNTVAIGGHFALTNPGNRLSIPYSAINGSYAACVFFQPQGALINCMLSTQSQNNRTNAPFDVWVRYTKE